jgi:hypothetical protein
MKRLITICVVTVITSVAYALPSDNFDDNFMDTSLWHLSHGDPIVWVDETNQRLELRSTGGVESGAGYFAKGWGFLPTDNFSFKVDFHFSATSGPSGLDAAVELYLVKDKDNELGIEAGCAVDIWGIPHPLFYYDLTIDGIDDPGAHKERTTNDGTLYISYDATEDKIYLSYTGYWAANAWITVPNLLNGTWGGSVVFPEIDGWSEGMVLDSGDAYLDNFVVDSGTIVPICQYMLVGDLNNDCKVDFRDFALMVANWLIDCDVTPGDPACVLK